MRKSGSKGTKTTTSGKTAINSTMTPVFGGRKGMRGKSGRTGKR